MRSVSWVSKVGSVGNIIGIVGNIIGIIIIGGAFVAALGARAAVSAHDDSPAARSWNPRAAAAYLDGRATWWAGWPNAARDHGTFCVSCHTTLSYALARPALRGPLGERAPGPAEARILDNLTTRVNMWRDVEPFYPDQIRGVPKTSESRATEAVLNALVLANRDAQTGHLAAETRAALGYMWALQMRTGEVSGAWTWLNFKNDPWESPVSPYLGASLAALAIGSAPDGYAESQDIHENLTLLRGYFQREYDHQPALNRLMALWASAKVTGLVTAEQRAALVDQTFALQQGDGGWGTASLGTYKRNDNTPLDTRSDGYATGLATLALQRGGVTASDARLAKGLNWLRANQDPVTGQWSASSLNKQRDPASDIGKFMSDAATAYAVLSLSQVGNGK
jgi:squalene-hopene/tetraprenyl-beta-curcumene cyclase